MNPDKAPPGREPGAELPAWIDTAELFGPANEILIRHAESVYRLRITRAGKLILTK